MNWKKSLPIEKQFTHFMAFLGYLMIPFISAFQWVIPRVWLYKKRYQQEFLNTLPAVCYKNMKVQREYQITDC